MTSVAAAAGSFASDGRRRNRETPRGLRASPPLCARRLRRRRRRRRTHTQTAVGTQRGVVRRPLSAGGPFAFLPRRRGGNAAAAAADADATLRRSALRRPPHTDLLAEPARHSVSRSSVVPIHCVPRASLTYAHTHTHKFIIQ